MTKIAPVRFVILGALLLALSACSKPGVEGTYAADFSTSNDPNVALAAALMKLSLTFEGQDVTMEVNALGKTQKVKVSAEFSGDKIILTKPDDPKKEKLVLVVKDSDTLACESCPKGMPSLWKKAK